ncbi:MAG TPA: NADH-ubiquinone oxidoreductase-F iron-sulfur binding region domain-containing protein [Candidatus Dormibacteraeota bacterium]|nr:NADH-ubiquinone oxidoreductase-F iron-sulfur binding region domain-containing protein [Candidatus Dormibacteraeota bacterium]
MGGPAPAAGYENIEDHQRRLGSRPAGGRPLIDLLAHSGLRGRGGAWFPTSRKWAAVADRSDGRAVVVINASEGEPLSAKDKTLMALRPHLVLDGAALAAESVGADDIVLYVSRGTGGTEKMVSLAAKERRRSGRDEPTIRIVRTAHRYIAGESSAVVNRVSGGPSKPKFGQRSSEKGVNDRPTLVQNVETLAHVAMIARYGSEWFRKLGTQTSPGSALMTVLGNVQHPGVYEVDLGARLGGVLEAAGGAVTPPAGALLGGYFGTWLPPAVLADLPLDVDVLRTKYGAAFGCGIVAVLPSEGCPVVEAARIFNYLAAETAGQCGPCVNGLAAIAASMNNIAQSNGGVGDLEKVRRWIDMVRNRGACHHPDGAVGLLSSALTVFADHVQMHVYRQRCYGARSSGFPQPPAAGQGWR